MIVDDNTIEAEGLDYLLKNPEKASAKTGKILANTVLKDPRRASEINTKTDSEAVSKKLEKLSSTIPDWKIFYATPKGVYLG